MNEYNDMLRAHVCRIYMLHCMNLILEGCQGEEENESWSQKKKKKISIYLQSYDSLRDSTDYNYYPEEKWMLPRYTSSVFFSL